MILKWMAGNIILTLKEEGKAEILTGIILCPPEDGKLFVLQVLWSITKLSFASKG